MIKLLPSALAGGCLIVLSATPTPAGQGSVTWINAEKRFDSIAQDGGGAEAFALVDAQAGSTLAVGPGRFEDGNRVPLGSGVRM